jgi:asparagine synthase (glutamine-hydrolysing)
MSALIGVFGPEALAARAAVSGMFGAMRNRAAGDPELFESPDALLAVARHPWESTVSPWTGAQLIVADDWVVAADASLCYLADLRRAFRAEGHDADGLVSDLLLAALRTWDSRFASRLEGDYAIIAYDRRNRRVLASRDFPGRCGLAWAHAADGSIVIASSPVAVIEHPRVARAYDVPFIAASAGGVEAHGQRTAFAGVSTVAGGTTLQFAQGKATVAWQWQPPPFSPEWSDAPPDRDAARHLLSLLQDSVRERMQPAAANAIFLSGGWDSTAVFAAGQSSLRAEGRTATSLRPISMTFPADDTGNEDDFIRAVAGRWDVPIRWLDSSDIPILADADRRAGVRDDPQVHPSESIIRRLCTEARAVGARVAFDGAGGDQLFHLSTASVLADHFFHGRWGQLVRDSKLWSSDRKGFFRYLLVPNLSAGSRQFLGLFRGKALAPFWERSAPPWIVQTDGLSELLESNPERRPDEGPAAYEARTALTGSLLSRAFSWNHAIGLDEGVQLRSPFLDRRLVTFAASRPLSERGYAGDSKRILRAAMRGLIPDQVLAARSLKTGTTVGYMRRQLQKTPEYSVERAMRLIEIGVVDPDAIRSVIETYRRTGAHFLGAHLLSTFEADRWLAKHPI